MLSLQFFNPSSGHLLWLSSKSGFKMSLISWSLDHQQGMPPVSLHWQEKRLFYIDRKAFLWYLTARINIWSLLIRQEFPDWAEIGWVPSALSLQIPQGSASVSLRIQEKTNNTDVGDGQWGWNKGSVSPLIIWDRQCISGNIFPEDGPTYWRYTKCKRILNTIFVITISSCNFNQIGSCKAEIDKNIRLTCFIGILHVFVPQIDHASQWVHVQIFFLNCASLRIGYMTCFTLGYWTFKLELHFQFLRITKWP